MTSEAPVKDDTKRAVRKAVLRERDAAIECLTARMRDADRMGATMVTRAFQLAVNALRQRAVELDQEDAG